jgi:hypothetical protein
MVRRFPAPWVMEEDEHGFRVTDATGFFICGIPHGEDLHRNGYQLCLPISLARRGKADCEGNLSAAGIIEAPSTMSSSVTSMLCWLFFHRFAVQMLQHLAEVATIKPLAAGRTDHEVILLARRRPTLRAKLRSHHAPPHVLRQHSLGSVASLGWR